MLNAPTDNLYKFMAVFGLVLTFSSSAFWWKSSSEFNEYMEASEEYLNVIPQGREAYVNFAKKTNEANAILNSVGGDLTKLSEDQLLEVRSILEEADVLKEETDRILNRSPTKRIALYSRLDWFELAKFMSFAGIVLGLIISSLGFYLWYTRLQIYIDKLNDEKNV